jgi:hypothetical protein
MIDLPCLVDYSFHDRSGAVNGLTVLVEPLEAPSWTGTFFASNPMGAAVSGMFSTPGPDYLCVAHRGVVFLGNVLDPASFSVAAAGIVSIQPDATVGKLFLIGHWTVTAIGPAGVEWATPRIAVEDIELHSTTGEWLRGVADPGDEGRPFQINLGDGRVMGGAQGLDAA